MKKFLSVITPAFALAASVPTGALLIPAEMAHAVSPGECGAMSRSYANSVAEPFTNDWMEAFISVHEPCMNAATGSGNGGGLGPSPVDVCRMYPECNPVLPGRLPSN